MAGAAGLLDPICENAMDKDAPSDHPAEGRPRGWCELAVDPQTLQPLDPPEGHGVLREVLSGDTDAIMAKPSTTSWSVKRGTPGRSTTEQALRRTGVLPGPAREGWRLISSGSGRRRSTPPIAF